MGIADLVVFVVIALLCALIGEMLATKRDAADRVVRPLVAVVGAILGAIVARVVGAPEPLTLVVGGHAFPVVWAIVGATLSTFASVRFFRPPVRPRRAYY